MKYTKTYEGFFRKSSIPQSLIDSVVGKLSGTFEVKVEKPKIKNDNVLDRVKISCKTKIGPVDLVISMRKTKGMFNSNDLFVSCYYGKERFVSSQISMSEIDTKTGELKSLSGGERIESSLYGYPNNISKYIEYTVNKVIKQNKVKKEFEDFYKKELVEEVKDLLLDLYDMLGEYKIEKKTVKGRKGFYIEFENTPKELAHTIYGKRDHTTDYKNIYYEPSTKHMQLLNEIHNLYMRLKDGYGLVLDYNLHAGLKLVILQDETPKDI